MVAVACLLGALSFVSGMLALAALLEDRFVSPRALTVSAVRGHRASPEFVEAVVAREFNHVLPVRGPSPRGFPITQP